jgi:hypothetical protein
VANSNTPKPKKRQRSQQYRGPITTYRRQAGAFIVETQSSPRFVLRSPPGLPTESAALFVAVGRDYGWQALIADLHELADLIEFNEIPGPADHAALYVEDPLATKDAAA